MDGTQISREAHIARPPALQDAVVRVDSRSWMEIVSPERSLKRQRQNSPAGLVEALHESHAFDHRFVLPFHEMIDRDRLVLSVTEHEP